MTLKISLTWWVKTFFFLQKKQINDFELNDENGNTYLFILKVIDKISGKKFKKLNIPENFNDVNLAIKIGNSNDRIKLFSKFPLKEFLKIKIRNTPLNSIAYKNNINYFFSKSLELKPSNFNETKVNKWFFGS